MSAVAETDTLSVLHSHNKCPMAKTWRADGTVMPYSKAKHFRLEQVKVKDIHDLSALLTRLEGCQDACIIRGEYVGDKLARERTSETEYKQGKVLRRDSIFSDHPLHTVLIEVDEFVPLHGDPVLDPLPCIREYITGHLPEAFWGASYHWQLSNSAGHPTKRGKLKAHLWFWLSTPRTSVQLKEWAKAVTLDADHSVFSHTQVHYTAAPIFAQGLTDPVPVRSGFVQGLIQDEVELDIEPSVLVSDEMNACRVRDLSRNTGEHDEVADWLRMNWNVLGESPDQTALYILCPWEHEHTIDAGPSSTVYFRAGTGGYAQGHFDCKHSHCSERSDGEFLDAMGYMASDFSNENLGEEKTVWEKSMDVLSMLRTPPAPIEWLVHDRIQKGRGILITGVGGSSKTRAMYHLAIGAAIGRLPWDWEIKTTGKSLLVLTEDTESDVHRTLWGICQDMDLSDGELEKVGDSVIPYPLAGSGCRLLTFDTKHVLEESKKLKELEEKIKSLGDVVFVGLDPALSLSSGDELDQSHQRMLGKMADDLAVRTGAAVALVSHASKASLVRDELDSHNSRGGGAITDAVRGEFSMRTMTAKEAAAAGISDIEERKRHVQLVATKGNHLPPSAYVPVWLRRGEHGSLSAADVVLEASQQGNVSAMDLKILEVLSEMPGASILEDWRAKCINRKLIASGSLEAQKKSMQRSVERLKRAGEITSLQRGIYTPSPCEALT